MVLQKPALKNRPAKSHSSLARVHCDVLKYIYAGMLVQLPAEKIRKFWHKFPPPLLPPGFEEADLFRFLWSGTQWLPLRYVIEVYNGLEPFLEDCDVRDVDFVSTMLQQVSRGSIVPASTLLSWMKPFIKLFFVNSDIRLLLLRIFNHFASKIVPEITFRIASHESEAKWNSTTLLGMHSSVIKRRYSLKKIFSDRLPPIDCELWVSMFLQMLPSCFNLPAFEERFIKGDSRHIQDILRERAIVQTKGKIVINGILYGISMGFHAFCRKNSIDLSTFAIPDCQVVVVIKDYFCPRKKRIILHKGCAYGAPVVLFGFNYKKNIPVPPGFLSPFLDEAVSFPASSWKKAEQCHEQLLETVSFKASFVYHTADGSISLNGEHFVKNVPAKILRKMLLSHSVTGQTIFSHREFAMDKSITNNPKAPNIIIRIRRLSQAIEERFPKIKIARVSRGKIALLPSCKIEFSEI
jgi:hypothetical protein